jgi:hypothetical protein
MLGIVGELMEKVIPRAGLISFLVSLMETFEPKLFSTPFIFYLCQNKDPPSSSSYYPACINYPQNKRGAEKSKRRIHPSVLKPVSGEYTTKGFQAIHSLFNPTQKKEASAKRRHTQLRSSSTKKLAHNKLYAKHQTSPEDSIQDATPPHRGIRANQHTHRR